MKTLLLAVAVAFVPLQLSAQDVKEFSGTITERWIAATARGPLQLARLRTATGRALVVDLGAVGGEQIPAR